MADGGGLPQNSVNSIPQDREGYLWIGTLGGLARFDGDRFTVFSSADARGLRSTRILDVRESRSGDLWIGTVDGGLTRLRDGIALTYTMEDGLPSDFVRSIREDNAGNLWINTARSVARSTASVCHAIENSLSWLSAMSWGSSALSKQHSSRRRL